MMMKRKVNEMLKFKRAGYPGEMIVEIDGVNAGYISKHSQGFWEYKGFLFGTLAEGKEWIRYQVKVGTL